MAVADAALEDVVDRQTLECLRTVVPPQAMEMVKAALKLAYLRGAQQGGAELGRAFQQRMIETLGRRT